MQQVFKKSFVVKTVIFINPETCVKPFLFFQAITSSVEMKDNATGSVRVSYYSSCVGDGPIRQTNKCSGLRVGSKVQFTGNIETFNPCFLTLFSTLIFSICPVRHFRIVVTNPYNQILAKRGPDSRFVVEVFKQ